MKKNVEDFVTVFFEGLMICCFNPNENRFETAILRRENHDFSVRIVKYDGDSKVEDKEYKDIPSEDVLFDFEGKGNPQVNGFRKFEAGTFDRKNESFNDSRDFRWLVDLEGEEFYNSKIEPTGQSLSKHKMPLVPVYVKNAEFYVNQLTYYLNDKVEDDEKGNEINREFFGKYGYVLGARMNADDIIMNFEGSPIPSLNVSRKDGFTYKIFITNTREGGDEQNELPVYYRVVKHPSNKQFNLERRDDSEVELYNRTNNCGKIILGKTETIEGLS